MLVQRGTLIAVTRAHGDGGCSIPSKDLTLTGAVLVGQGSRGDRPACQAERS